MFRLDPFALSAEYVEAVLPLALVKAHLSIDDGEDEFDAELAVYAAAAVDQVEKYCSLALGPQADRVWRAESLPARIVLPGPNVVVTAVGYLDGSGDPQTVDVATLRLAAGGVLVAKPGQSWPGDMAAGIEIRFSAGYAEGEAPRSLVQAALLFTGHLFANREAVITGTISGEIPLGFKTLCSAYRMPVL
ncbi:head-tail connector protein [Tsuneonella sp. HG094]